jgi:hypothetical protein
MPDMKEEKNESEFFYWRIFAKIRPKNCDFKNTFLQKFANKNTLIGTHLSRTQNHS